MCYHASVASTIQNVEDYYQKPFDGDVFPSFESKESIIGYHLNGFAFPKLPILSMKNSISLFHWGLIPSWVNNTDKAMQLRVNTLNAKCETIFEKPSFKSSIYNQRCLIPVTGFFEWQTRGANHKVPHHIHLPKKPIFSLAGIYSAWRNPSTQQILETFSIITCEANELMQRIHNSKKRMPCIVPAELEKKWLDPNLTQYDIEAMLSAYPSNEMDAYPITHVIQGNNESSNVPAVLHPIPNAFGDLFS
jgi:putative SOS response-associated peptidase YedK